MTTLIYMTHVGFKYLVTWVLIKTLHMSQTSAHWGAMILRHSIAAVPLEICHWLYSLKSLLKDLFVCHKDLRLLSCGFDEVIFLKDWICFSWLRILRKKFWK